jgi:hypothetical protein
MLNGVDPGIAAEREFDQMLYKAYLWLKAPHIVESISQTLREQATPKD